MRRWIFGALATFGVTAAIAVPLLVGSGGSSRSHNDSAVRDMERQIEALQKLHPYTPNSGVIVYVRGMRLVATGYDHRYSRTH